MTQAAVLFSHQEEQYAFGELDEDGKTKLAQFAARSIDRCQISAPPKGACILRRVRQSSRRPSRR